jgi:hypothetical protein
MDPTPASDIAALKEDPTDPWNYLAAVPMLGNAAQFARAIRKGDALDLPKDFQWRVDKDTTPDEMRKIYAEEFITDLEVEGLEGQALIDEVMELQKVDPDLYEAVGEHMPDFMKNIDTTTETFESLSDVGKAVAMEDANRIIAELAGSPPEVIQQALKELAQNDPAVLQLVRQGLSAQ